MKPSIVLLLSLAQETLSFPWLHADLSDNAKRDLEVVKRDPELVTLLQSLYKDQLQERDEFFAAMASYTEESEDDSASTLEKRTSANCLPCHASRTAPTLGARNFQFTFIDAPFKLKRGVLPSFDLDGAKQDDPNRDLDAYTWWHLTGSRPPFLFEGLDIALSSIAKTVLTDGPFDGIIGFSQGAGLAVMVASLLEHGRKDAFDRAEPSGSMPYPPAFVTKTTTIQPPLNFVIAISGFAGVRIPLYQAFYHPKIVTPTLHLLGEQNDFIKMVISQNLIDSCAESQVLYHSGGHRVPRQADFEF